eukprot:1158287-Pelagomonas_calceolata.AAC.5
MQAPPPLVRVLALRLPCDDDYPATGLQALLSYPSPKLNKVTLLEIYKIAVFHSDPALGCTPHRQHQWSVQLASAAVLADTFYK